MFILESSLMTDHRTFKNPVQVLFSEVIYNYSFSTTQECAKFVVLLRSLLLAYDSQISAVFGFVHR